MGPIENGKERREALTNINTLLQKPGKVYSVQATDCQQTSLEQLVIKVFDGSDVCYGGKFCCHRSVPCVALTIHLKS